jgi:hypothetical protein
VAIRKWPVVIILMAVAVPSGCLPVATVGSAIEATRVPRTRSPVADEQKRRAAVGAAVVLGLLSAASLLVYGYLWRRTFAEPDREVMGLRKVVWRVLLVLSQGVGVAIGLVILFQSR